MILPIYLIVVFPLLNVQKLYMYVCVCVYSVCVCVYSVCVCVQCVCLQCVYIQCVCVCAPCSSLFDHGWEKITMSPLGNLQEVMTEIVQIGRAHV